MSLKREMRRKECTGYLEFVKTCDNDLPLNLYSFKVYLAYKKMWKLINRELLTEEEIIIMKNLNIYTYPRRYTGNEKHKNKYN